MFPKIQKQENEFPALEGGEFQRCSGHECSTLIIRLVTALKGLMEVGFVPFLCYVKEHKEIFTSISVLRPWTFQTPECTTVYSHTF